MSSAYKFCPACGQPLAARAADARLACACGFIHWDNPVPVVAAIVEHEGAVILARNRDWPEKMYGLVTGFLEKPTRQYEVSMGIYMVSRSVVAGIPGGQPYGFDHLMRDLLAKQRRVHVRRFDGYWLDIGRADDYAQAIEEFGSMRSRFVRE